MVIQAQADILKILNGTAKAQEKVDEELRMTVTQLNTTVKELNTTLEEKTREIGQLKGTDYWWCLFLV